jgi:large subunit ribosomal protein L21
MKVDLLDVAEGNKVELTSVLFVSDGDKTLIGTPKVEGAKVIASCLGDKKDKKVIVFKYKAKVRYRKKTGHRQGYTHLAIEQIVLPGQSAEVKS